MEKLPTHKPADFAPLLQLAKQGARGTPKDIGIVVAPTGDPAAPLVGLVTADDKVIVRAELDPASAASFVAEAVTRVNEALPATHVQVVAEIDESGPDPDPDPDPDPTPHVGPIITTPPKNPQRPPQRPGKGLEDRRGGRRSSFAQLGPIVPTPPSEPHREPGPREEVLLSIVGEVLAFQRRCLMRFASRRLPAAGGARHARVKTRVRTQTRTRVQSRARTKPGR